MNLETAVAPTAGSVENPKLKVPTWVLRTVQVGAVVLSIKFLAVALGIVTLSRSPTGGGFYVLGYNEINVLDRRLDGWPSAIVFVVDLPFLLSLWWVGGRAYAHMFPSRSKARFLLLAGMVVPPAPVLWAIGRLVWRDRIARTATMIVAAVVSTTAIGAFGLVLISPVMLSPWRAAVFGQAGLVWLTSLLAATASLKHA